ncbi:class I SAM-dependent RNA methyltransferase [Nocardia sp. ET3-3]|uniref:Class I SAM-dependent RNA methyltransferase n=1 Tax=Nocardia terrae TaxID=2675851 RepID=A0A7K1UT03_9NOCA|nr:class I SAM-dependent RNA methyltransferase [Nocardia terrae]
MPQHAKPAPEAHVRDETRDASPDAAPPGVAPGRIGGVATHLASSLIARPDTGKSDAPRTGVSAGVFDSKGEAAASRPASAIVGELGEVGAALVDSTADVAERGGAQAAIPVGGAVVSTPTARAGGAELIVASGGLLSAAGYTAGWRSRVRLAVDSDGRAGVHGYRSSEVIADLRCPQPMAGAMDGIADRKWTPGADLVVAVDGDGMRHIVEVAPAEVEQGDRRGRQERGAGGARRGGDRRSTATRRAAAHGARDERVVDGTGRAVQYVAERRWELSATGFWQPHYGAAQCYSDVVAEWAEAAPGSLVWDLYCGVGVFAARLAEQVGDRGLVHGVEFARSAVTEGRAALRDMPWVDLTAERVERWIHEQPGTAPDVVVLDPPRAGAGKDVINALSERSPRRIIHIGCDPAAFARDVGLYRTTGYQPIGLRVFDAFPGTHHVECIAVFER